jgi:hypothetical protein
MQNQLRYLFAVTVVLLVLGLGEQPVSAQNNGIPDQIAALQAQVNSLQTANADLQAQVSSLQASLMTLQHNSVLALNNVLSYNASTKAATFTGANVFIVNGQGTTASANGVGNLVVGYNEPPNPPPVFFCTDGQFLDQASCVAAGDVWGNTQRLLGSHNVVVGKGHSFTRFGGLVVGNTSVINRDFASVSGGEFNIASGISSSVSGGQGNAATGQSSSISGGLGNVATGEISSVSGGGGNNATGQSSSISGGDGSVASGQSSSVSGGGGNLASGAFSSVSGGLRLSASADDSWAAGAFHTP